MDRGIMMEMVDMVAVDMVAEVEVVAEVRTSEDEEGGIILKDPVAIMTMVKAKYQLLGDVVSYFFSKRPVNSHSSALVG